jgi:hypothetical protein
VRAILGDIYDAWRAQNFDWLGSYLPDDLCHVIHIPVELHPLGGTRRGKKGALARLQLIVAQFHFDEIDTSDLLIERNRRGGSADTLPPPGNRRAVRIDQVEFLDLEDGWPVKLTEYHAIARVQAFVSAVAGAHPA